MTEFALASSTAQGGTVAYGDASGLEDNYGDCTIGCKVSIQNIEDQRLLAISGIRLDCVSGTTGWYPRAGVTTVLGDEVTVTDPTERDLITPLDLHATYDATTGVLTLYVDRSSVGSDSVEEPAQRANAGKYWYTALPAASWITNIAAWSSVLEFGSSVDPELSGWWDASDASTIHASGGVVDQWDDKSGNGVNLTASGASRPATGVATIGGLNALQFDATNDLIGVASPPGEVGFSADRLYTLYMVYRHRGTGVTGQHNYIKAGTGWAGGAPGGWEIYAYSFGLEHDAGGGTGATRSVHYHNFPTFGAAHLLTAQMNGTNASKVLRIDGVTSTPTGNPLANNPGVGAGTRYALTIGLYSNFDLGEVRIYGAYHDSAKRAAVEAELQTKWGL